MTKVKKFTKKVYLFFADFFNPKEWTKLFRSVPAIALTLIVLANVLMNLVAAKSIIEVPANVPTSWFTNGSNKWIIQDAGILISWIGFLVGDLLVKAFGSKNAIRINIASLGISLFISFLLIGVANIQKIPGINANWSVAFGDNGLLPNAAELNAAVDGVIGNMWQVILGSAAATFVGILVNNITHGVLLNKMIKKHGDHYFGYFIAAGASTIFGQVIDNIVFALIIGTRFFGWSLFSVLMCSLLGGLVELVAEMLFTPLTYKISKNWEKNQIGKKWMDAKSDALTATGVI
jgi:uncharacterized PurR-regulated membrane protein YhhQ (DUF165 family)